MKTKVVYFSRTGNTRKIAEAIASVSGTTAESTEKCKINETIDLLFLGGAVYATYDHNFHPSIGNFISSIDKRYVRKVATFTTCAFGSSIDKLNGMVRKAGLKLIEENFVCKGRFLFFNIRHPNKHEISDAKDFSKKITTSTGKSRK
jgi:flavodoxin